MCFGHQTYSSSNPRSIASLCMHVCLLSCFSRVWLIATPWTIAHQALLSMGFSRQEHWSMLPCSSLGDLPNPRIDPCLLHLLYWQAGSLPLTPWASVPSLLKLMIMAPIPEDKEPRIGSSRHRALPRNPADPQSLHILQIQPCILSSGNTAP